MHTAPLKSQIEAVLFMSHKPISLAKLQEIINPETDLEEFRTAISNLMADHFSEERGIELVEVANGFQFRTKIDQKDIIHRLFAVTPIKLSQAMLEVLSIIAYNQPITREKVEQVRGVDCSHLFRVLLDRKMVRMVGKSEDPGRPMLYGTTKEFLELFGLRDLNALPSLREIEDMLPVANEVGERRSEEELLAEEMAGIVAASHPLEFNDLELEEGENETEKSQPSEANSYSRPAVDQPENSGEAGDSLLQPHEIARGLPMGPEGNA